MSRPVRVPEETQRKQAAASNPKTSAWVSANAGSGKTHVLSQRVIRLLLDGTDPSRILCLTYTRAAAANMANRVFQTLARWTTLSDADLANAVASVEGLLPVADRLLRARRLFAEALETPGGLKIQTIHAFCEAVLHQFPLEANVAGHFELLDSRMEQALVAEARRSLIAGATGEGDEDLASAFATILETGSEHGLDQLLAEIVRRRDHLKTFLLEITSGDGDVSALYVPFGFSQRDDVGSIAATVWPDTYFTSALADAVETRALDAGKQNAADFAVKLRAVAATTDAGHRLELLRDTFLTKKSTGWEARSTKPILTKGVAEHFPDLGEEFARTAGAVQSACDRAALLSMLHATRSALVVADRLIARYERLKSARGYLDFNDLITRTVNLLTRRDAGAWVQYKLDKGIDHILLDEAQDTSPDQWRVVKSLAEEFFSGLGSRDGAGRTIFAVGDEKQSIYSFQGAEPEAFSISGHEFAQRVRASEQSFEHVRLLQSFRSTQDVLSAVDLVFARDETRKGLSMDDLPIEHSAIRDQAPGLVEVWPLVTPQEIEQPEDWTEAIDHAKAPATQLAVRIAATIEAWLKNAEMLEGRGTRLKPGDVMVLVRKRDAFVHALSRELKSRHVPVAGADRLLLTDHIAVQDLMAIARIVLQPDDDLSLAAALKSPIFGFDEDALYRLAHGRDRASLWSRLRQAAERDTAFAGAFEQLRGWRDEVGYLAPFEFFARILGRDGARARIIARLGQEAGDVVDEFLSFCLAAERAGVAGLEALIALLIEGGPEIKREMDQSRGEVRIMTAHAAKGLEAPVVFLVDSGSAPISDSHLPTLLPFEPPGRSWDGKGYLWRSGAATSNSFARSVTDALKEKAEEEYRRLLYVGMTRAEDRLIVCGYQGKRAPGPMIWHNLVRSALEDAPAATGSLHPLDGGPILRYRATESAPVAPLEAETSLDRPMDAAPALLSQPAAPVPPLPRPLSPSRAGLLIEADASADRLPRSPVLAVDDEPAQAIRKGSLTHKLLQSLPDLPPDERLPSARRYLDHMADDWDPGEREGLLQRVFAVLDSMAHQALFLPGSRAEVVIMGELTLNGQRRTVSGKIDRLAITKDEIIIVDYKTNRTIPLGSEDLPEEHVAQLALYSALIGQLYPGRSVRAALLYTEGPRLIDIPSGALAGSLARLGAA